MLLEKDVRKFVSRCVDDMAARLAVLIGADHNISATSQNILKSAREHFATCFNDAMRDLECHAQNTGEFHTRQAHKGLGMIWDDAERFHALPFREKIVFLTDKHTREFAAYWLMQEYPEIYQSLPAALEVVDDTFSGFVNESAHLFPKPDLFMYIEE